MAALAVVVPSGLVMVTSFSGCGEVDGEIWPVDGDDACESGFGARRRLLLLLVWRLLVGHMLVMLLLMNALSPLLICCSCTKRGEYTDWWLAPLLGRLE